MRKFASALKRIEAAFGQVGLVTVARVSFGEGPDVTPRLPGMRRDCYFLNVSQDKCPELFEGGIFLCLPDYLPLIYPKASPERLARIDTFIRSTLRPCL